jgi:hypothetical protein
MIYEFALTPGLFCQNGNTPLLSALQYLLVTITRESHVIGVVRKRLWRPSVFQAVTSLPSPFRERLHNLLSVLKDRGRIISRQYQTNTENALKADPDWLDEFLLAHTENPFDAIVTLSESRESCQGTKECIYDVESLLETSLFTTYEHSKRVKREAAEFVKVLRPLLRYARSILLIDPHIDPTVQRYLRPVSALLNSTFDRGRYPAPAIVEMHTKASDDVAIQEAQMRGSLLPRMNPGTRVRVVLWAEKQIQETFHNRFFLTDLCGIEVGHGFDESTHGGPDHDDWSVMAENHRQNIWRQFQKGSTTFEQKHEFYLIS